MLSKLAHSLVKQQTKQCEFELSVCMKYVITFFVLDYLNTFIFYCRVLVCFVVVVVGKTTCSSLCNHHKQQNINNEKFMSACQNQQYMCIRAVSVCSLCCDIINKSSCSFLFSFSFSVVSAAAKSCKKLL